MKKIKDLIKKFLDNPKFSVLVAVFQGFAVVLSFLVYRAYSEFWGMTHSVGGEGPMEVSTRVWIMNLGWYFSWGVLPHLILGTLQINYLMKLFKKWDKPVSDRILRLVVIVFCLGIIVFGVVSLLFSFLGRF